MEGTSYFDNAATTFPKPEMVYTFMDQFYRECGVNVGRGQYKLASKAAALVSETRELMLELLSAKNKQVVFTHTATEAINLILRGISIPEHCNVFISPFEHNSVTRVLNHIQELQDIRIHHLSVDKMTFQYNLAEIKSQFSTHNPSLVIVNHASNVCGLVAPIQEICNLAKTFNALTVVDLCQTAGLIDITLNSDNIDYAVFAGHKALYGPFGVAGFVSSNTIKLTPLIYGGTGIDSSDQHMPKSAPERYEAASPNIMAIAGLNAALKWLLQTGVQTIREKEEQNHSKLLTALRKHPNIRIVGEQSGTATIGVVSCEFKGYSNDEIGRILSEYGIAVRTGLHCSPLAHQFLGTYPSGSVRFSVSYFNNDNDFEALNKALNIISESV